MIRTVLLVLALVAEVLAGVCPGGLMRCVHADGTSEIELAVASACPDCCGAADTGRSPEGRNEVRPRPESACAGCRDEALVFVRLPLGVRRIRLDAARPPLLAFALPLPSAAAADLHAATSDRIERGRPPPDPPPLVVRTVVLRC